MTSEPIRRLLLLGATGRTGGHILDYALAQGYEVVALVRNPEKIAVISSNLHVVEGTPENPGDVIRAIEGCNAIVSVLNNNRTSDMPWAKSTSPALFMTKSIAHCIGAMKPRGIHRITVLSAIGVGDSFADTSAILKLLIRFTNLKAVYEDHEAQEALLKKSNLDWTSVRASGLSDRDDPSKELIVSYGNQPKPNAFISRQRVAQFMIDSLSDANYFGKTPVISER